MTPEAELRSRLSDALGAHDLDWDTRAAIQGAYMAAGADTATWADLPAGIRAKIEAIETLPRTSWEDPSEAPDDVDDEPDEDTPAAVDPRTIGADDQEPDDSDPAEADEIGETDASPDAG